MRQCSRQLVASKQLPLKKVTTKLRLPQNDKKNNYGSMAFQKINQATRFDHLQFFLKCGRKLVILSNNWGIFLVMGSNPILYSLFLYWGQPLTYYPPVWFSPLANDFLKIVKDRKQFYLGKNEPISYFIFNKRDHP